MDLVTALTAAPPASRPDAGGGSDAATGDGAFAGLLGQTTAAPAVAPEAAGIEAPALPVPPATPEAAAQPVGMVSPEEILALAGAKAEGEPPPPASKPAGGLHRAHRVDLGPGLQELADGGTEAEFGAESGAVTPAVPDLAGGPAATAEGVTPDVQLDAEPAGTAPDPAALAALAAPPPAPPPAVPVGPPELGPAPDAAAVTAAPAVPATPTAPAAGEAAATPAPQVPAQAPPPGTAAVPAQPLDPETPAGPTPAQLQAAAVAAAATLAAAPAGETVVEPVEAAIATAMPAPPRNDGARGRTEAARNAPPAGQVADAAAAISTIAANSNTTPVAPTAQTADAGAENPFGNGTELMRAEAVDPLTLPGAQTQAATQSRAAAEVAALQTKPSLAHLTAAGQVAVHVSRALDTGADSISIRLDPADLGRVDVKLDFGADGRVVATVLAEKPETLSLLQRDSQSLERALAEAGLRADSGSLNFGLRKDDGGFGQEAGGREGGGTGFGRNGGGSLDDAAPIIPPRALAAMRALDIRV